VKGGGGGFKRSVDPGAMVVDGVVDGTGTPLCSNRATHPGANLSALNVNSAANPAV